MAEEGSIANLPFAGGTAGQEALTPGAPSVGKLMNPPKLVQGAPPRDENEFNQLFTEAKQYLERPDVKAFLLQAGVQLLQPRPPGVPVISQVGQAIGAGSQAALGVQKRAEEQSRFERKDARAEARLGLDTRRVGVLEKGEERQRVQGAKRLELDEKLIGIRERMVRVSQSQASTAAARLAELKRQFDAELKVKTAENEERAKRWKAELEAKVTASERANESKLISESMRAESSRAKANLEQLKKEIEARELTKEGTPERKAIDQRIKELSQRSTFDINNAQSYLQRLKGIAGGPAGGGEPSERGGSVSGTPAAAATARPVDSSAVDRVISEGRAATALQLEKDGRVKFTPEQRQKLEAAVGKSTASKRAKIKTLTDADVIALETKVAGRRGQGSIPSNPGEVALSILSRGESVVRSSDDFNKLSEDHQKYIVGSLDQLFPEDKPPTDSTLWQLVLKYPLLEAYVRKRYGDRAEKLLETTRKNVQEGEQARAAKEAEKAQKAAEAEARRRALSGQ